MPFFRRVGHDMVSHRCALKLKREFPEVYWIADMRDELRVPRTQIRYSVMASVVVASIGKSDENDVGYVGSDIVGVKADS